MKRFIYFISFFFIVSCVGGYSGAPENSSYSEKNNLLVERYTFPPDTVTIFNDQYRIVDAWVSNNFKQRNSKEINFNYLVFFCSFKNTVTNEYFINQTKGDVFDLISHNLEDNGFGFEGLGNEFSNFSIFLKDKNIENLPDTIKIFVKQGKEIKTLNFYKYSSFYD